MSVSAIVFSKDRASQLDLLLCSLEENAPGFLASLSVLFATSGEDYAAAYLLCEDEHPEATFYFQRDFDLDLWMLLERAGDEVAFFCDDDVLYRPLDGVPQPEEMLRDQNIQSVALRLGKNTTYCYPLRQEQKLPLFGAYEADGLCWDWRQGHLDWSYIASLDGNVYRTVDVRQMILGRPFKNPNQLEDQMMRACLDRYVPPPLGACYHESLLVSVPVNRVNTTHGNRHAESYAYDANLLNVRYLHGQRLALADIDFSPVNAAHTELALLP